MKLGEKQFNTGLSPYGTEIAYDSEPAILVLNYKISYKRKINLSNQMNQTRTRQIETGQNETDIELRWDKFRSNSIKSGTVNYRFRTEIGNLWNHSYS